MRLHALKVKKRLSYRDGSRESLSNTGVILKVQSIGHLPSKAHHLITDDSVCYTYKYINSPLSMLFLGMEFQYCLKNTYTNTKINDRAS